MPVAYSNRESTTLILEKIRSRKSKSINKRNNAGPRKFKVPQRKETYKMKAFIRKNKHNSTTKVFRVKCSGKKGISEKSKYVVHQKITAKKTSSPEKGTTHTFSGQTLRQKKYGFQGSNKKCMGSKKKGIHTFSRPNIMP